MDAKKITEICTAYKNGTKNFADASFELIMEGLTAEEVKKLLL